MSYSINQKITLSFTSGGVPPVVKATQFDNNMRIVDVTMTANGVPFEVPAGYSVHVRLRKPDGKHVYNPALEVIGNRARILLTQQMLCFAGTANAILEVVDGAEKEWGRIDYDYRYGADRALTHNAPHLALLANDLLTGSYNADASSVTAYKGQTRGITLLQSANYEKYEFDCITDFSVDGNNITWTTAHMSIPYVSGFNYYTTQYVNGIMVTQ